MTKAFIEIPQHSRYKYELDKETNTLILDRPLNQSIPANYGFIPNTLSEDGDPLDVFVITKPKYPLVPGTFCKVHFIGIMYCNDNGVTDHKLIATLENENNMLLWNREITQIENYLQTYKDGFIYQSYSDLDSALKELYKCQELYNASKPA